MRSEFGGGGWIFGILDAAAPRGGGLKFKIPKSSSVRELDLYLQYNNSIDCVTTTEESSESAELEEQGDCGQKSVAVVGVSSIPTNLHLPVVNEYVRVIRDETVPMLWREVLSLLYYKTSIACVGVKFKNQLFNPPAGSLSLTITDSDSKLSFIIHQNFRTRQLYRSHLGRRF